MAKSKPRVKVPKSASAGEVITMESEVSAEESPLPSALQTLLGAKKFALVNKARWHVGHFDQAHAATFESSPRLMGQRVVVRGAAVAVILRVL